MEQQKSSFSWIVKSEIMQKQPNRKADMLDETMVFLRVCGSLCLGSGIIFEVDKPSYAKRLYSHIKALYSISPKIHLKRFNRLGRNYKYFIKISDKDVCRQILFDAGYIQKSGIITINHGINKSNRKTVRQRQNILRAAFLLCGSISNPEKNYHLELVFSAKELADSIAGCMADLGFRAKIIERKNTFVVYLKEAEEIADFLTTISATSSILDFQNIKLIKEIRNDVNRGVNCETANINKTVDTAARQIKSIEKIKHTVGLFSLPEDLYQVACLRMENPELSLKDMAELCDPVLSKSGLNHRFKRIEKIASELKNV